MTHEIKCKICGSNDIEKKFDNDERILQCQKCEVAFLSSKMVNYNPAEYYSEEAGYSAITASQERHSFITDNAGVVMGLIGKYVSGKGSLLDVGAHTGIFVREANKNGFEAVGIEPDTDSVKWANENSIPLYRSDIENFSTDKKFDTITVLHVLEHVADPVSVLNKLRNLLKKDGAVVIEVPDISSYLAKKDGIFWKFIALEHIFYFSRRSLQRLLEGLGFRVIVARQRNHEINYLSINKLARYFIGGGLIRDRFKSKDRSIHAGSIIAENTGFYKRLIKRVLVSLINLLRRQDHILIIAQKR